MTLADLHRLWLRAYDQLDADSPTVENPRTPVESVPAPLVDIFSSVDKRVMAVHLPHPRAIGLEPLLVITTGFYTLYLDAVYSVEGLTVKPDVEAIGVIDVSSMRPQRFMDENAHTRVQDAPYQFVVALQQYDIDASLDLLLDYTVYSYG